MDILLLPLVIIAWVSVPGALFGWLAGFINWHLYIAILWAIIILITYQRSKMILSSAKLIFSLRWRWNQFAPGSYVQKVHKSFW